MRIARIAVALDGSRLAETVLPAARSLAGTLAAELALVHVIERAPPREVHGEAHLATRDQAQAYLDELAVRIVGEGVECATKVAEAVENDVPAALEAQARELGADLIALCAHGASNLRERVVGRIAERTLQRGSIPVLLRTARTPQAPAFELRNLLTPIEQGHDIGAAVDASRTIAGAYGATRHAPVGARAGVGTRRAPPARRFGTRLRAQSRRHERASRTARLRASPRDHRGAGRRG